MMNLWPEWLYLNICRILKTKLKYNHSGQRFIINNQYSFHTCGILIIDDEPLARMVVLEYLQNFKNEIEVLQECNTSISFLKFCRYSSTTIRAKGSSSIIKIPQV